MRLLLAINQVEKSTMTSVNRKQLNQKGADQDFTVIECKDLGIATGVLLNMKASQFAREPTGHKHETQRMMKLLIIRHLPRSKNDHLRHWNCCKRDDSNNNV